MQKSILKEYQTIFKDDTLQEISKRTSIHISRIFRILNGSSMKVKEFEQFQNAIIRESGNSTHFLMNLSRKCLDSLSVNRLNEIIFEMKMALTITEQIERNQSRRHL